MQLLLSNPKSKKRRRRKAKRASRRRRTTTTTRKVPMARKSKSRRRRSSPPAARRRKSPRRSFGGRSGGFINKELLLTGAGVAGGLLLTPMLDRFIPSQVRQYRYGVAAAKGVAGLATFYFLKRSNRSLALALAAGMIASGITDVAQGLLPGGAGSGKTAGYDGYDLEGGGAVTLALPDGSEVSAYDQGDGTAVDGLGNMYELEAA